MSSKQAVCLQWVRHWCELMTGRASVPLIVSVSCHQFVWVTVLGLPVCFHNDKLPLTIVTQHPSLGKSGKVLGFFFSNQVPLTAFLLHPQQHNRDSWLISHFCIKLRGVFVGFWVTESSLQCAKDLLVDHAVQAGTRNWKSHWLVTYRPTLPDSLQIRAVGVCSMFTCVCVCVFTPSSATVPHGAPREASSALPHLHSSQQLGSGLTGSFSPLCMERHSSHAEEQPGTQSGFIISYLLSSTNVQGARASF